MECTIYASFKHISAINASAASMTATSLRAKKPPTAEGALGFGRAALILRQKRSTTVPARSKGSWVVLRSARLYLFAYSVELRGPEMKLTAVFQKVREGYVGFVEELPGANTQARCVELAPAASTAW